MIVIDGIIVNTNLADINVNDIKSVEVVKGAAAAALYGSKAGNGVLVITTKRGTDIKGKTRVTFRSEYGIQQIPHYIEQAKHHPYSLPTIGKSIKILQNITVYCTTRSAM